MRAKRLWWLLLLAYLWVPLAALLFLGLYGGRLVRDFYLEHLSDDLEVRARLVSRQVADLLERGDHAAIDSLCKELGKATETRLTVVLASGEPIGDSQEDPRNMDNHRERPEVRDAMAGALGRSIRFSSTVQQEMVYVATPLPGSGAPTAIVRAAVPLTALSETLAAVQRRILGTGLLGALLIALVSLAIARRLSHPLEIIRAGAEAFAAGRLDHRLPAVGSEEVRAVAAAMNRMAQQLNQRIQTIVRQQNEREAMLSSMEEGVLAIDNGGCILSANAACATWFGQEPAQLVGRTVYEVIRKPDLLRFVEQALASEAPVEEEIRILGPEDRWLIARGVALHDAERGRIGVLVVLHDVTRLRRLESLRRDFVANVSHELRTPVTSIKGFLETLLDGALEEKENAVRFLHIMLRQVNRLDAIISDLLSLSRIERGAEEQMIELVASPVAESLRAAVEMCQQRAADKGILLELTCPDDLVAPINGPLLEQAVVNLIDNAIKYSEPGSPVRVAAQREASEVVIRVIDQGCGIEAQHLPRLFERFYRVDTSRSRDLGGTGLGLAIVKHIALAHRGSVEVQSAVGAGSAFFLRLPASDR